jgi:hypothetical protein
MWQNFAIVLQYSHKKGSKCTSERGILHLDFDFKRQRYRR